MSGSGSTSVESVGGAATMMTNQQNDSNSGVNTIGLSTLSLLPSPSIQLARGLASMVHKTSHNNNELFLNELNNMNAFTLFQMQLESGCTEAATDSMKRLGVVCQAMGRDITMKEIIPYLTRLVLQNQQQGNSSTNLQHHHHHHSNIMQQHSPSTSVIPPEGGGIEDPATTSTPTTSGMESSLENDLSNVLLSDELLLILGQQLLDVNDVITPPKSMNTTTTSSTSSSTDPYYYGNQHQDLFLPLLERLSSVEETVVRDQAVTVLATLCQQKAEMLVLYHNNKNSSSSSTTTPTTTSSVPPTPVPVNVAMIVTSWLALVQRLSSADWFTAKVSACGIVAPVFTLVNATAVIVGCNNQTVATTTSTTTDSGSSSSSSASQLPSSGGVDDEATTTTTTAAAATTASSTDASSSELLIQQQQQIIKYYESLLSIYKELCMDETPMVRRSAAKHMGHVLKQSGYQYGRELLGTSLLPLLCRDEQDSVRLLAVSSLKDVGTTFGTISTTYTIQYWLPIIKDGSTDMSWRVRNNLAKHFSDVAATLGIQHDRRYHAEQSLVMACFVAMLTDAEAEVRAAAVTHLAKMVIWGGPLHFSTHLQPLLAALGDDVVMEVRSKCALALMDAAHSGTLEDNVILHVFGPLFEGFLVDEFHEVQLQVLSNLHKIAHLLPGLSGVVSSLLQMSKAANWRVREAVAKLLPHLAEARGLDFFRNVLLEPSWLSLLLDPVASVRQSIVRGMALLVHVAGQEWIVNNLLLHHIRIYNNHANSYLVRITILSTHIQAAVQCQYGGILWNDIVLQIVQRGLVDRVPNVRMVAARGLKAIIKATNDEPYKIGGSTASGAAAAGGGGGVVGEGLGTTTSTPHVTSEDTQAMLQTQIRPALELRIQEDGDEDVQSACQEALDELMSGGL